MPTPRQRPIGERFQHVWAAVAVLLAVPAAIVASLTIAARVKGSGRTADVEQSSTSSVGSQFGTTPTAAPPGGPPATSATGESLGRDVPLARTEQCHAPGVGTGAEWLPGAVRVGGERYDFAYSCNLVAGGSGTLEFVIGTKYKSLSGIIGCSDDPGSTTHRVRFWVIADDKEYLLDKTLTFGDRDRFTVDVTGVTRLKFAVAEQGSPGGSGQPSKPVWADSI